MTDPITGHPFIEGAGRHVPPPGADWTEHTAGLDCIAHIDAAREGRVPDGGRIAPGVAPEDGRQGSLGFVVGPTSPLLERGSAGEQPCAACSRAVIEAPSPVKALARLVATGAHRDHVSARLPDDLPF